MKVNQLKALCLVVCLIACPALTLAQTRSTAATVPQFDIPYEKFVLPNGLTVIVHEDHKAPIVAVNVWYHVGSKNEKPGKTGFAHLFEHLMFNGSEHFNNDYFQALERIGATDLNGTTNEDRTNYFQNVPVSALDTVLWLESDRMGHLLGAINKERLDEQRGVVQNEKRQGENEPYSISDELITKAVFPASHPYSHTVIGSMEDLDAASLDDVKEWFKNSYGPGNAVVVIAGDIDAKTARAKVEKYFGEIPPGPPVAHFEKWVAPRTGEQRQIAQDRVPQARLYKVWNVPGLGTADNDYLTLLSDVLVSDKASRLYKRLVYDEQIATDVGAFMDQREIGSLFIVQVTAKPSGDLAKVEKAVNEEMQKVMATAPAQDELERVRTQIFAQFVRGAERIGGFGGKSDILARSQVFGGSPDSYKQSLTRMGAATTTDLQAAGKRWLSDGVYTLQIVPYPNAQASQTAADRSQMPMPGEGPEPKFPATQRGKLSNGLEVIVAERHGVPVVNMNLLVDAGFAADQFAQPGTASLAMNMLDEGTKTKNSIEISKELASLGASLGAGSNLDTSTVALSTLKSTLDRALNLFSDVILNPAFPQSDFDRLQKLQIAGIQREKSQPVQMGLRVFPKLLYGPGHAYGNPYTGSGTEESVAKLTRADLIKFHETWFKPNNATLVVVGDTTLAEMQPKLEALFAGWKSGQVPSKNIATVEQKAKPVVYLVDKPGAIQSVILAGVLAPPKSNPDEIAIESMNTVLGGAFISRLNMNLRENKHWSYGAGSFIPGARGQRIYLVYAPVQTDKTKESVTEIVGELRGILKDKLVTADELAMAKSNLTQTLPGQWETNASVADSIGEIVQFKLTPDYYSTYAGKVKALSVSNLNAAALQVVKPDSLVWVIVGDREKIEKGIRELGLGEVQVIDADGNPVK
jgi:zinc protease